MLYTSRPFNYAGDLPNQVQHDLDLANDNFDILRRAFINDDPTTGIVKGPWVDVRAYNSINDAIGAIGDEEKTLLIPNIQTLIGDLVIPSNVTIIILRGGGIANPSPSVRYKLTINGSVIAGLYQIFYNFSPGDVIFGVGSVEKVYPQWWGAKGDGITDDYFAIQSAIDSVKLIKGTVYFTPNVGRSWAIGSTLIIDKPITLLGSGAGSYENEGYFVPSTLIKWIGNSGGTMLNIGDGINAIAGVVVKDIAFDGQGETSVGLCLKMVRQSVFENLLIKHTKIGMKLEALATSGDNQNVMFNEFRNIHFIDYWSEGDTQGIVMVINDHGNCCMNRFYNLRIGFKGDSPALVVKGDNNAFFGTYIQRASGTGYGVEIGSEIGVCQANYFYHLQASTGGLHVTYNSNGNVVFGYSQNNDEPLPVVDPGSSLLCFLVKGINWLYNLIGLRGLSTGFKEKYVLTGAVRVNSGATSVDVSFSDFCPPQPDDNYAVFVTPTWNTTYSVTNKTTTGFTVNFGTPPLGDGYIEWFLIGK
jgi:hypothetical protein